MLQPTESTVELIVEKQTLRTQQTNALNAKQEEYDRILERAQVVLEQMNAIRESVLVFESELQTLRTELLLSPGPPLQPRPENVRVSPGAPEEFADPAETPCGQPSMDVDRVEDSNKQMRVAAHQNPEDVQSMLSGISDDMLLTVLAQGQREMDERQAGEQRRTAALSEGGQEG